MVTYFETYDVNVNNAFAGFYYNYTYGSSGYNNNNNNQNDDNNNYNYPSNNYTQYDYHVKFQRLNHLPYNYRFNVNSDKAQSAVIRIFVGPKYDANGQGFTLPQASQYYFQLDQFVVECK